MTFSLYNSYYGYSEKCWKPDSFLDIEFLVWVGREKNMKEDIHSNTGQEKYVICHEIADLLRIPDDDRALMQTDTMDEILIASIVDTLVTYGKNKEQIHKIAQISKLLSQKMGLGEVHVEIIEKAALIYDVGNLKIDPDIYKKGNRLSFEEFEIIKEHTSIGYEVLKAQKSKILDMGASLSAEHHEWYDGSGYPYGLAGEEISIFARIVALADTAGALSAPRYGRQTVDFGEILAHVHKRSDSQFDPMIVEQFHESKEVIEEILEYGFSSNDERA